MKNILLAMVVILATTICCDQGVSQVKNVTNQELVQLMEKGELQLVDVRTPEETADGMIGGARNIDFRSPGFKADIDKLDKNKPIAVYCGAGGRSGKTSVMLQELGFKEIYDLGGGFSQWKAEDFPVTKP